MDTNIVNSVYSTLKDGTEKIAKNIVEREKLEGKIQSGRYSAEALRTEIYPKRDALKQKIKEDSAAALQAAKSLIDQYQADIETMNDLDPAEITDDIKLLQAGIHLLPRDIQAILRRNSGNKTMLQLALRYAKQNDIDTGGTFFVGGERERENAKNLSELVNIYSHWIDTPDGLKMLDEFFNVEG